MIFSLYYKEIITMKNIKKIGVSILAAFGLISIITGTTLQERQIGKYQIDCEFTSQTSRAHCVTLNTENGDIFTTLKIKKSDFELRN